MPITLSSRFARRTALAGAAATLSIALAACSASFSAPTLQPYQAAEGTNVESGQVKVRNMLVLADAEGKGELHSVIVNDGDTPETLVSIQQAAPGTADGQAGSDQPGEVKFTGLTEPLELEPHTALVLPGTGTEAPAAETTPSATPTATETPSAPTPGAEEAGPAIIVTGAKPGQMVNVTITFGSAAPVSAYVPVLTDDHYSPSPAAAE
ncbi:hypothetical protein [Kribbella speibonae]|uniref:Copper chaperone PCu(A)C n=1 Tax=Kribbella speibonae TaxID=1572660 RepID=A0A4R0ILE5_9ACTN|nr:hypothetical protein [Kribbella speibonae]TCC27926.1 hypothetical protein E0H58_08325 [Kribbella speibonae]TCC29485.1 hypothetical protein E0H92_41380 [Kribbella speibonae]